MLHRYEDKKEIYKIDGAVGYEVAQLQTYAIIQLEIETEIPAHAVPLEMTFTVLAGVGLCSIEGEESATVSYGDVMTVPSGLSRGWKSIGETPLRLLAIRGSQPL